MNHAFLVAVAEVSGGRSSGIDTPLTWAASSGMDALCFLCAPSMLGNSS